MRTNIDIDDAVLGAAMKAGPFTTKKDAVEAGLRLLARQAAYRELLRWEGQLHWDGDDALGAAGTPLTTGAANRSPALQVQEPASTTASRTRRRHGGG